MKYPTGSRLYIGNLAYTASEDDLADAFEHAGHPIVEVKIPTDRETGRPRGFAFIQMETTEAAQAALQAMDGCDVGGRAIKVAEATEKPRW